MKKIGIIVGSLRKGSYNKIVANYIGKKLEGSYEVHDIDISKLPLYNQDSDANPPAEWVSFREEIKNMNGFLFATPEYNRSFSGAIKNALDIASRPYGANMWSGKPAAVVSASMGSIGGFGANNHLRQVLAFLDVNVMAQPEAYVGEIQTALDENGNIVDEDTTGFLDDFSASFSSWIERLG